MLKTIDNFFNKFSKDKFIFLCILFSNKPIFIKLVPTLDVLFTFCLFIIVTLYVFHLYRYYSATEYVISRNNPIVYFIIWFLILLINTFLKTPNEVVNLLLRFFVMFFSYISFSSIQHADNVAKLLMYVKRYFICFIVLDFVTIIIPIGNYFFDINYTLIGTDNYAAFSILIMLAIVFQISCSQKGKLDKGDFCLFLIAFCCKIYTNSTTAIYSMTFFGLLVFVFNFRKEIMVNIFTLINFTSVAVVFMFSISIFTNILYKLLLVIGIDKGITLSYRTIIWPNVISAMSRYPLFGFGYYNGSNLQFQRTIGLSDIATAANHCHNFLLEILFISGVVGFFLFFYGCIILFKQCLREKCLNNFLCIGFCAYFLTGIFDGYIDLNIFFSLIALMINYKKFFI